MGTASGVNADLGNDAPWRPQASNSSSLPHQVRLKGPLLWFLMVITLTSGLAALAFLSWQLSRRPDAVAAALSVLFLAGDAAITWFLLQPQLTLYPDRIVEHRFMSERSLDRSDIEGVRFRDAGNGLQMIVLQPRPGRGRAINLMLGMLRDPVFAAWLEGARNLDYDEAEPSRAEVLADRRYGADAAEREGRLGWAMRLVQGLTWLSLGLWAWALLHPRPYPVLITTVAVLPWLGLLLAWRSQGLITLGVERKEVRPSILPLVAQAAAVLCLRSATDMQIVDWKPLAAISVGVGLAVGFAAARHQKGGRNFADMMFLAGLAAGLYSYGLAAQLNFWLDRAPPQVLPVIVEGKHETDKPHSFDFEVGGWNGRRAASLHGSQALYRGASVGSVVCLSLHRGALAMPWYGLDYCRPGQWRSPGAQVQPTPRGPALAVPPGTR